MSLYFKGKIIGTRPWASGQDDNDVIEQIVIVETPDQRFGILDGFVMQVKPEAVGKVKDISIIVPVAKVKKIRDEKPGLEPSGANALGYKGHIYYGKVIAVGIKDIWHHEPGYQYLICVDVGFTDILVDLDKETIQTIKVGDFIEVNASMTTLLRIK